MPPEFTNLMPADRVRGIARNYFLRLGTVGVLLASALVVIHAILLVPSYLILHEQITGRADLLAKTKAQGGSSDAAALEARLSSITKQANILLAIDTRKDAVILGEVLAVPHQGVSLNGFNFSSAGAKGGPTLSISGVASSREALQSYNLAMQHAAFAKSVALPVGAYAQETSIAFTLTVTLVSP